ncbi:MAG: hypothetical protein FD135_3565 [Comamonadaceae bacterium]|nr:MAG: hypothetical protein FD135_3565 [Comamonadaceae bacterium]
MQVFSRLNVIAAFLVARSRLVAKAANQMVEGVAQGLNTDRT